MIYKNYVIVELSSYQGEDSSLEVSVFDEQGNTVSQTMWMICPLGFDAPDFGYRSLKEAMDTIDAATCEVGR